MAGYLWSWAVHPAAAQVLRAQGVMGRPGGPVGRGRRPAGLLALLLGGGGAALAPRGAALAVGLLRGPDQAVGPRLLAAAAALALLALAVLAAHVELLVRVAVLRGEVLQEGAAEAALQRVCHVGVLWGEGEHTSSFRHSKFRIIHFRAKFYGGVWWGVIPRTMAHLGYFFVPRL